MKILVCSTFVGLVLAGASGAAAAEVNRSFDHRFEVEPGARLVLEHEDGDVEITPWSEDVIAVEVIYRVDAKRVGLGRDPDLEVSFEERGGVAWVIGKEKDVGGVGFFSIEVIEYVYRIQAPPYVELELRGEDGDVEIDGWQGEISVRGDDGDVRLDGIRSPRVRLQIEDGDVDVTDLEGRLELEADDGDVTVRDCRGEHVRIEAEDGEVRLERCSGNFEIVTDDGDIDLFELQATRLDARSSDGSIRIELEAATGALDLEVRTEDGDVSLELGPDVSAAFDLSTEDGDVRIDAEVEGLVESRERARGRLGDGSGKIRVSTDSGRIELRQ